MAALRKCPQCGSEEAVRSHRRFVERLLPGIRSYRCSGCNYRFLSFSRFKESQQAGLESSRPYVFPPLTPGAAPGDSGVEIEDGKPRP
jgi:hypothetical protein